MHLIKMVYINIPSAFEETFLFNISHPNLQLQRFLSPLSTPVASTGSTLNTVLDLHDTDPNTPSNQDENNVAPLSSHIHASIFFCFTKQSVLNSLIHGAIFNLSCPYPQMQRFSSVLGTPITSTGTASNAVSDLHSTHPSTPSNGQHESNIELFYDSVSEKSWNKTSFIE